ncbi:MAG: tetratricopeptide repeat protein [Chloroflexi bacterium]|jgi:putative thioredoxin|nr:tetratricopeptide repeat protein [Anaerolineaceae bacterium]NLI44807.1 tetratricopeptide repeat protein [Chloroflexota bacterium]HOE35486.1 tetratricopeptide repeat protein [Anaerolineaceae bacterium]HOT26149.1 tetratricopeptide repeat protein [Anaerolineaceae bacterium]HQH58471.1 tetratricopeptide repeat protein [Anaerolineaceae bacterium]
MTDDYIIDVSDESFELEVVNYSTKVPVVMDFWAPWCIPCRVQSPLLAKIAQEAEGAFRLARVNVDDQTKLAERLKVKNVPAVKAFVDGRIVAEFTGVLSEPNLRHLIRSLLPDSSDLLLEKGKSLILLGDYREAEEALGRFVSGNPRHPGGILALARLMLIQGRAREANLLLSNFPASHEFSAAQQLKPVVAAYLWLDSVQNPPADALEAAYRNSLKLARKGKILLALDGFLDILRKDKGYRNGEVREVYLGLLEVLGETHPEVRQYRADLTNVLF